MNKWVAIVLALLSPGTLGATGSAINEPALVGRSDIIHFESFEASDWWKQTGWEGDKPRSEGGWEHPNVTTNLFQMTSTAPVPGTKSLGIEMDYGSHAGSVNPRVSLDAYNLDEAYIRYYIRMPTEMSYSDPNPAAPLYRDDGKLPGLARRGPGNTQQCCMGQDYVLPGDCAVGWSARMYWWGHPTNAAWLKFSNYTYNCNDLGTPGEQYTPSATFQEGQWYCLEQRVKMNTPGQSDGILENWVDGVKIGSWNTLKFRSVEANNIGEVWFGVYVGGANVASATYRVQFDNFVVARNRVGCYEADSGGVTLPAPTNISYTP